MGPTKYKKPMVFYAQKWGYSQATIYKYSKEGCNFDLSDEDVGNWILARSPRVVRDQNAEVKECSNCKEKKPYSDFHKHKSNNDGLAYKCKDCIKSTYEEKNKDSIEAKNKKIAQNAERRKTAEYIEARRKRHRASDRRRIKARREYSRKKRSSDPLYKLGITIRGRIHKAIKKNSKSSSTRDLLGCSIKHVRKHLESQFKDGMTWNNHGINGWHIDHIIPCASFDLSDPLQQKKCFHYTNLQPLWAIENLIKSNNMPINHQPELIIKL